MGVHRGVCAKPSEIFLFNRNKRRSQELYQNVSNNTFVKKWRELPRVSCDDGDALSHRVPPSEGLNLLGALVFRGFCATVKASRHVLVTR